MPFFPSFLSVGFLPCPPKQKGILMEKQIEYKADTHEYLYGNEKFNSVTELASLYSKLNTEWLQAHPEYAARGTLVHDELSKYVDGELGIADMQYELSKQIAAYLVPSKSMKSEVIVYNTEHHYAGTADVIKVNGLLVESIVDFKTGTHRNKLYEQCQLSLYLLALKDMGYNTDNTALFVLAPDGYHEYQPLSWDRMQQLEEGDLAPDDDALTDIQRLVARSEMLRPFQEEFEAIQGELRQLLVGQFESKKASTFVYNDYMYTYLEPSVRKSVDTAKMKEAGIYEDYIKETPTVASVRITKRKTNA